VSRWPADHARAALLRALEPHVRPFTLLRATSRDWASALFLGARHRFALALDGEDAAARAARLRDSLPEMELDLRGGFVADCQAIVTRLDGQPVLEIDALTIEEPETVALSRGVRRAG
jgi:hypothetical protein